MVKRILSHVDFPLIVFGFFFALWIVARVGGHDEKAAIYLTGLALTALKIYDRG